MKIIDLLNKIANGEEVPKKIKFGDYQYEYYERVKGLFNFKEIDTGEYFTDDWFTESVLNDEVEIIEEEKEIEKLKLNDSDVWTGKSDGELIVEKINELIDVINDMRDKEC